MARMASERTRLFNPCPGFQYQRGTERETAVVNLYSYLVSCSKRVVRLSCYTSIESGGGKRGSVTT